MANANLPGQFAVPIGPNVFNVSITNPATLGATLDATNEAIICIGQIVWADGGSHTLNTTGSSSIFWRTGTVTFANAGTSVVVGIGAVDTSAGPPGRATNVADVITQDVFSLLVGGGGGVTTNAAQNSVPTSGTKTMATGDLVALSIQMIARGGADSVIVSTASGAINHLASVTTFLGGSYTATASSANMVVTASDGTLGWFYNAEVFSTINTRTWNSGSATKEYGQLLQLPFPVSIMGLYGWLDPDADTDIVLYSDPLGTPVAEKTFSVDANWVASSTPRRFQLMFAAPYVAAANQALGAVFKPGGSNISAYYKTLANAAHRVTDPWGTSGYGISRASGAFADANSGLDNYYIGFLAKGFSDGTGGGATALPPVRWSA